MKPARAFFRFFFFFQTFNNSRWVNGDIDCFPFLRGGDHLWTAAEDNGRVAAQGSRGNFNNIIIFHLVVDML